MEDIKVTREYNNNEQLNLPLRKTGKSDVAVIGMACRFPGANNYQKFWENLINGVNSIHEADRWNIKDKYSADINDNKSISKWCGLLDDIDKFDNDFFNISPREAIHMDPQQRILMEEAWHCIEDSGVPLKKLQEKRTSVFVGAMAMDSYFGSCNDSDIDVHSSTGIYEFMLANRLSYFLRLNGESKVVEAGCASAFVALYDAIKSFSVNDCDYSIVAGANLHYSHLKYLMWSKSRMLSADGNCKTFDKSANGFVSGEGFGVILLQPLEKAILEGNNILGVIKGCAINHGGKAVSVTAPRVEAQREVILSAYEDAGFTPDTVTYVETHGTGTALGDPIEIEALTQAFRRYTQEKQFCKVGSVKTNIGHLEAAAGMPGIIKVLLMMKYKKIPAILNFQVTNPIIDFEESPFIINTSLTEWARVGQGLPLRAGISSFGIGGVNSHVLVEEYLGRTNEYECPDEASYPFLLSAKNKNSLNELVTRWKQFVNSYEFSELRFRDICLTLQTGREHFPFRCSEVLKNKDELIEFLDKCKENSFHVLNNSEQCLCFGKYTWSKLRYLESSLNCLPILKEKIEEVMDTLDEFHEDKSIRKGLYNQTWRGSYITLYSSIITYTFVSTLIELGFSPNSVTGYDNGLWISLAISGIVDFKDALAVLCNKMEIEQLKISRPKIPFLDPVNNKVLMPFNIDKNYVEQLISNLKVSDTLLSYYLDKTHLLVNSHFTFKRFIEEWNLPLKPYGLDVYGLINKKEFFNDGNYNTSNIKLLSMVIILSSLYRQNQKWNLSQRKELLDERFYELLELVIDDVMPKETLITLLINDKPDLNAVAKILDSRQSKISEKQSYKLLNECGKNMPEILDMSSWVKQLSQLVANQGTFKGNFIDFGNMIEIYNESLNLQSKGELSNILKNVLVGLWQQGAEIKWEKLYSSSPFQRVQLPVYAFSCSPFWLNSKTSKNTAEVENNVITDFIHPLLHRNTSNLAEQRFSTTFIGSEFFLKDHIVGGRKLLPGVAFLEMARAAVLQALSGLVNEQVGIKIKNVFWIQPFVSGQSPEQLNISIFPNQNDEFDFKIYSEGEDTDVEQVVYSQGTVKLVPLAEVPIIDLAALKMKCNKNSMSSVECYNIFQTIGIEYGPGHRGIEHISIGANQILTKIKLPSIVNETLNKFVLHPSIMDSALQSLIGLLSENKELKPFLPFTLQEIDIFKICTSSMWALASCSEGSKQEKMFEKFDIDLCNDKGEVCVRMRGFSLRTLKGNAQTTNINMKGISELLVGNVMLTPVWDVIPIEKVGSFPALTGKVLVIGGDTVSRKTVFEYYTKAGMMNISVNDTIDGIARKLDAFGTIDHIIWIATKNDVKCMTDERIVKGQDEGVIQVFRIIKALLRLGYGTRDLYWTLITNRTQPINKNEMINPTHSSIYGLIGSMAKEYQNWSIRLVDMEDDCKLPVDEILALPYNQYGNVLAYRGKEWYHEKLVPIKYPEGRCTKYKVGGVYVLIGGAGGIGETLSEYLIRMYQAKIVWIGRSELNKTIQAKLDRLASIGTAPIYISADATQRDALQKAYNEIKQKYGKINGIIHSAIVLLDRSIANMEEDHFRAGLKAKVDVCVRIAQVFHDEELDFVIFFSSINSFSKTAGQSNYVAGCIFKDIFAHQLSQKWSCEVKVMNWGYWGSTGIVASEEYQKRLSKIGLDSIEPEDAMEALEILLSGAIGQMAFLKTTKPKVIEQMDQGEVVEIYPKVIPIDIDSVQSRIHKKDPQLMQLKSGLGMQIEEMEGVLCRLLWGILQSMGLMNKKEWFITEFKTESGILDLYNRWLKETIAILIRNKYLNGSTAHFTVEYNIMIDTDVLWKEWESKRCTWLEEPSMRAYVALAEETIKVLPGILRGKQRATDIMFQNSSIAMVEGIYKGNKVADYFNEVLAEVLTAYIEEIIKQDKAKTVRILEIGAGSGGTSSIVFKRLQPYKEYIDEYCYTDISKAFLLHAEKEYGAQNTYLTYKMFNVEQPVAEQDINAGAYDIVIAANVLHATRNIRHTLRNAKACLKTNGILLLNEICANTLFTHLTFGLLEGWWRYEDKVLRIPGCPAVLPQTWKTVLEGEGFWSVFFSDQDAFELGQQIICAQSNGIVHQKRKLTAASNIIEEKGTMEIADKGTPIQLKSSDNKLGDRVQGLLKERTTAYIKNLVGKTLQTSTEKIDSSESLEKYGIDSILVVQMTNALSKDLNNISSTLFFEYQTIDALVDHFIETQKDSLTKLVGLDSQKYDVKIDENKKSDLLEPAHPTQLCGQSKRFLKFDNVVKQGSAIQAHSIQDVAIIGLSGRYPQAYNVNELWNKLSEGKNCITEIPEGRWNWKEYFDEEKGKKGKMYTKWGGFIDDIDKFDPLFFRISPREAEQMDPQERLFLEIAYSSIEDAGYTPGTLCENRKIGVFVGVMNGYYPTSSNYWSIANRISYLLNFQGPSMAVDTACSSSLTAIHLALESLYSGNSECAIAGGVNLIVDPSHYLRLTEMRMLSPGNELKAFGNQADGFIDAEGVGAIVLKPLQKAIEDQDHIYGIIKGSTLNAGGKTKGYTVPNPSAQSMLITDALKRSNINARMISYLEAHGTGTFLGDPIEIAGLSRAFEQDTKDKQFCAIGSIKSNIGHCESAAGIAGLTKVLLQLKHKKIVPSLHSAITNPNIDFTNTPFIVQQEIMEWRQPVVSIDGKPKSCPRIAGISAFGAGGANAHIVVQEYIPIQQEQPRIAFSSQEPVIIVLSAKSEDRLKEQAKHLLASVEEQEFQDSDLPDIAFTLQVGREAFEERVAFIIESITGLQEKLTSIVNGEKNISGMYHGHVEIKKGILSVFSVDEDLRKAIDSWIYKRKYYELLKLWVKGLNFDWNRFYVDTMPKRISLPTYPFSRESYWLTGTEHHISGLKIKAVNGAAAAIHPLLHQNTSDFSEQRYTSLFTGEEFFLMDHKVMGRMVLPGVAHLEMAVTALNSALGSRKESKFGIRLKNVVWAKPITLETQPVNVNIALFPQESGEISYEIYSIPKEDYTEPLVYSQGSAELIPKPEDLTIDIAALQAQHKQSIISMDDFYAIFKDSKIDYGDAFKGVEEVFIGTSQVVAKLILPSCVSDTIGQYILHPSLMDSALQATVCLLIGAAGFKLELPFAMEELEVFDRCTPEMWAQIRYTDDSNMNNRVHKFDIDLCNKDEDGRVCVRIKGLSTKASDTEAYTDIVSTNLEVMMFEHCWKERQANKSVGVSDYAERLVILCEVGNGSSGQIEACLVEPGHTCRCILMRPHYEGIEERFQDYAMRLFKEIRDIIIDKPEENILVQVVVPDNGEQQVFSGLRGLLKTAQAENPRIIGQLIELGQEDTEEIIDKLKAESLSVSDSYVKYQGSKRYVGNWSEVVIPVRSVKVPWKDNGTYLITGGVGGLGFIFAKEAARRAKAVTLILIGRSPMNESIYAKLDEVQKLGAQTEYRQVDVSSKQEVMDLMNYIKDNFGALSGIIHSAGIVRDNLILKKPIEEFSQVLKPKVTGLVNLDQASKDVRLDFFILFSSLAGVVGNPGQADYATANAFMDAFAKYRNSLIDSNKRWGKTLSVNWSLWMDGGMQVNKENEKLLGENLGIVPIETPAGIQALYLSLATIKDQVVVAKGSAEQLMGKLLTGTSAVVSMPTNIQTGEYLEECDNFEITDKVKRTLVEIVSRILKVNTKDILIDGEYSEYGFDKVMFTGFVKQLNEEYKIDLTPLELIGYTTIDSTARFLVKKYGAKFLKQFSPVLAENLPDTNKEKLKVIIDQDILTEKAVEYLKKILSSVLKIPPNDIDSNAPMEKYGIDSIMIMKLTGQMEKTFGSLSKTLFFEYQDIQSLAVYFVNTYPEIMSDVLKIQEDTTETKVTNNGTSETGQERDFSRYDRLRFSPNRALYSKVCDSFDVAIIGVSGRYPQARNLMEYWNNLKQGKDCIQEIPEARWDHSPYFDEDKNNQGKTYSKWGGFLDGVDEFDPLFFNISPREAEIIDPQERLFLQCVYETLEDAGYTREYLAGLKGQEQDGNVGVYVGVMYGEYQLYGAQEQLQGKMVAFSSSPASIANRVSYFCNFHGPSMALDTMCSSSLTAIHLACQDLYHGNCELALAGGVNVSIHPNKYLLLGQGKFASSKGRCESFGQGGDGYVPGEGVGAILLKPLSKSIADGDHIYGVIKSTAINHGGKTNGYTVPNPNAQEQVIGQAIKKAGINPRTISYIEAHGTGTVLGDPIEITGLNKAFQKHTNAKQFCSIGSVKSNIGHCESAAGIAGLTKILLQLKYRQIVPSLHSEVLNPNIDFSNTAFVVPQELTEWKRPVICDRNGASKVYPRIAGLSSFGAGGANAHIIIEEYSPKEKRDNKLQAPFIFVMSAKNEEKLKERVQQLLAAMSQQQFTDSDLPDMAYTLQVGREAMEERLGLIVNKISELENKLKGFVEGQEVEGIYHGQIKRNKEALAAFASDDDISKVLEVWITKGKYQKLLDIWVKGMNLDWNKLYTGAKPKRISMPVYPFARERYWAPSDAVSKCITASVDENLIVSRTNSILQKQWVESAAIPTRKTGGTVAVLATNATKGLAAKLSQCIPMSCVLDESCLNSTEFDWENYNGLIDLAGCDKEKTDDSWIKWLQQLVEYGNKKGMLLLYVTKGLESFRNNKINMSAASRVGLYRMLQSEYIKLQSRHMDAEKDINDVDLIQQIATEYYIESDESEICYREGKRYAACLNEILKKGEADKKLKFPEGHVLLITGGTRGLGYLCAQHFVKNYGVKKLVLVGKEWMPPRDEWDAYIGKNTSIAKKILAVKELEDQNVQVRVLSVPLVDREALGRRLKEIKKDMGPVSGVIHCAGAGDTESPAFIRKTIEGIRKVINPKTKGLDTLYEILKDEILQFFVLFSSVSAVVPALAVGQSDYAMGNAYMDYFATYVNKDCPMVSIQWPNWKDTGMGEVKSKTYEQTGLYSLSNDEGLRLLDIILGHKLGPVVLPVISNQELWRPEILMQKSLGDISKTKVKIQHPITERQVGSDVSAGSEIESWLVDLFASELKMNPTKLSIDTSFQDYGVDSVLLAQILRKINQALSVDLDPTVLYEFPTVRLLKEFLLSAKVNYLSKNLTIQTQEEAARATENSLSTIIKKDALKHSEQKRLKMKKSSSSMDIAVIGLSCRFPGANTLDEYWKLLSEGRSAIVPVPQERWGYSNGYYAGLLDNITHFDYKFFLIPEEDASVMDPQALIVLEESLKLLCHAGYSQQEIKGKAVGVYIGGRSLHRPSETGLLEAHNPIVVIGQNYLASNVSHFFDLHGPSVVIDTACSSALTGMSMAIQALKSGELESAIVGGVSLLNTDSVHRVFEQRGILSKGSEFHIFDQRASGVVLGEGIGMVLLKTIDQAIADGDTIYGVIKAAAINNDGRTAGPAAPNLQAQKEVMHMALAQSNISAEEVNYIEVNGSGSEILDLLELKAVQAVYRKNGLVPCGLGSVKPNIGHSLCAEGIASFIKLVMMLYNRKFVPFLSGEQFMTHYDINASPFYFHRNITGWTNTRKIAAINCFADGGTNAHLILTAWDKNPHVIKRKPIEHTGLTRFDISRSQAVTLPSDYTNKHTDYKREIMLKETCLERNSRIFNNSNSIWKRNEGGDCSER